MYLWNPINIIIRLGDRSDSHLHNIGKSCGGGGGFTVAVCGGGRRFDFKFFFQINASNSPRRRQCA